MILAEQDVARLPERIKRELIRGEHARAEFAIHAQNRLKEALEQMPPRRHIDGIGRHRACIHPELAARLRVKHGNSCLHDPDFLKVLLRDNPFLRANCVPAKVTVRVNGLKPDVEAGKRHGAQGNPATPFDHGHETAAAGAPPPNPTLRNMSASAVKLTKQRPSRESSFKRIAGECRVIGRKYPTNSPERGIFHLLATVFNGETKCLRSMR